MDHGSTWDGDGVAAGATSRREFLQLSALALSTLAIGCSDDELVAEPVVQEPPPPPPIQVTPSDDLPIAAEVSAPTAFRASNGELLAYIGRQTTYFWPAGGTRPGLRVLITGERGSFSGGYGIQLDRPSGFGGPLETIYSIDGHRKWETGLDTGDDASGQGRGPDFVLAYDNSYPAGDRFRMAPGGYLRHGPIVGTPNLNHRFHIQGRGSDIDRAINLLYLEAGSREEPAVAEWLIRGDGRDPTTGLWGQTVFAVDVDGAITGSGLVLTGEASDWRITVADDLHARRGEALAIRYANLTSFLFAADGRAFADAGWSTFSPAPPRPAEAMSPRDWCDWAYEDAGKPVKPYDGLPTEAHPAVRERADRTARDPSELAREDRERYGKDISKVAIGTSQWVRLVQDALERAESFAEFKRLIAGRD